MFTGNNLSIMKRLLILFTVLISVICTANDSVGLEMILKELDQYIEKSPTYVTEKERKIDNLRNRLKNSAEEQSFELNFALFEEYQSYRYDSAYFYANRSLELAKALQNNDKIVRSQCALVFCYLSSGLFLEAFDEMNKVDASKTTEEIRKEYYSLYNRLYYDASDFNDTERWSEEYTRLGTIYADSLLSLVAPGSYEYVFTVAQKEIRHANYSRCIDLYKQLLADYNISDHNKAIINSSIGGAYKELEQQDSSMV